MVGGEGGVAKVTQVGSALPRYASDYWRAPDGRGPAPLRWCAPEVLCQVRRRATQSCLTCRGGEAELNTVTI